MKEIDPEILKYAARADEITPEVAMDFLIQMYIDNCGISMAARTIADTASLFWCKKMVEDNPDLPEGLVLFSVAEMRSEEFRKYKDDIVSHDIYEILLLDFEDINRMAVDLMNEYDSSEAKIAIAAGIKSWLDPYAKSKINSNIIDQAALSELIAERLANPEKFIDKPLIIWGAVYNDGVQEYLLHEVYKAYNSGKTKDEWKGVMVNPKRANADKLGLLIIDAGEDYRESLERYAGLPVVVYAGGGYLEELSVDFPHAESYTCIPDFEQWAECVKAYKGIPSWLVDFIRSDSDIYYAWYHYFKNEDFREGCDYPKRWLDGIRRLRMYMKVRRIDKYSQVPEDFFKKCFSPGITDDLIEDLREYLKQHNF